MEKNNIVELKLDNAGKKVWYVAYDIDIKKDEFEKYIKNCKDTTMPEMDKPYILNGGSYYTGYDKTGRWNDGGHVYLRKDLIGFTFGHAYKISVEQLIEIYEMKRKEYKTFLNKKSTLDIITVEKSDESYYTITEKELCEFNGPSKEYVECLIDGIHDIYPNFNKSILEVYAYYRAVPGWCLDVMDNMLDGEWIKEYDIWYQCRYEEDINQLQMMVKSGIFIQDGVLGEAKYKLNLEKLELARRLLLYKRIDSIRMGRQFIKDVDDPKYISYLYDKPISIKCKYREIESIQDPEYFIKSHYYSNIIDDMCLEDWPLFSNMEDRFEYTKAIIDNVKLEDGESENNKKIYGYIIGLAQDDIMLFSLMKLINEPLVLDDIYSGKYVEDIKNNTNLIKVYKNDNTGTKECVINESEIDTFDNVVMYALLSRTYNMRFVYELLDAFENYYID